MVKEECMGMENIFEIIEPYILTGATQTEVKKEE